MDGQGVHRWGPLPGVIELEYFIGLGEKGGCRKRDASERRWVLVRYFQGMCIIVLGNVL